MQAIATILALSAFLGATVLAMGIQFLLTGVQEFFG